MQIPLEFEIDKVVNLNFRLTVVEDLPTSCLESCGAPRLRRTIVEVSKNL